MKTLLLMCLIPSGAAWADQALAQLRSWPGGCDVSQPAEVRPVAVRHEAQPGPMPADKAQIPIPRGIPAAEWQGLSLLRDPELGVLGFVGSSQGFHMLYDLDGRIVALEEESLTKPIVDLIDLGAALSGGMLLHGLAVKVLGKGLIEGVLHGLGEYSLHHGLHHGSRALHALLSNEEAREVLRVRARQIASRRGAR